jgi:hypothetical protein
VKYTGHPSPGAVDLEPPYSVWRLDDLISETGYTYSHYRGQYHEFSDLAALVVEDD